MDIIKHIKKNLEEAEIYTTQGLLTEAKEKYNHALQIFIKNKHIKNREKFIDVIKNKISCIDNDIESMENSSVAPEISSRAQNLIKKLFSFSKDNDEDSASLEGAIAMAKFGQFERAMAEFKGLLKKETVKFEAAKNILRCLFAISSINEAVTQFKQWESSSIFTPMQIDKLRIFLEDRLSKKDNAVTIDDLEKSENKKKSIDIPEKEADKPLGKSSELIDEETMEDNFAATFESQIPDDEVLDISSMGIVLKKGPEKGSLVEIDVSFQSGNIINFLISKTETTLLENLKPGTHFDEVQFYSPIAMFKGACIVTGMTNIESGPKQGEYNVEIKIMKS